MGRLQTVLLTEQFLQRNYCVDFLCKAVAGGALNETCVAQDARSRFQPNGENTVDGIFVVVPEVTA